MPVQSAWADNYISLFGFYQPNALNIALQKAVGYAGVNAHSYPMTWYNLSIGSPSTPPLGFRRSSEYDAANSLPSSAFPPAELDFPLGDAYHQTPLASDQLSLEPLPPQNVFQTIVPLFGNGADAVVNGIRGTAQGVGDVTTAVQNAAQAADQWIATGVSYADSMAAQGGQTLMNLYNSAVLRITLRTPATLLGPQLPQSGPRPQDNGTGSQPMVWLPIQIPTNALAMAFDFTVAGDPVDDVMECGIGTTNLFSLEAKYIPTNVISSSRLVSVSAWAGTTNEVFFGFVGGTSTNATLTIDNIRFYSLEKPRLEMQTAASTVVLKWPSTAVGYVLETTPALTSSPLWEVVTNPPTLSSNRYVLTNSWSDHARFFRLRSR
jgi:hypothetical protein